MTTMTQLIEILKQKDIEVFHTKSKIQAIVDGESISEVSAEHVRLIANKLRALKII